jgi:hypothetical protein
LAFSFLAELPNYPSYLFTCYFVLISLDAKVGSQPAIRGVRAQGFSSDSKPARSMLERYSKYFSDTFSRHFGE